MWSFAQLLSLLGAFLCVAYKLSFLVQASESSRFITRFPIELLIKGKPVLTEADFQQIRTHFITYSKKIAEMNQRLAKPIVGHGNDGHAIFTLVLRVICNKTLPTATTL